MGEIKCFVKYLDIDGMVAVVRDVMKFVTNIIIGKVVDVRFVEKREKRGMIMSLLTERA
jgi:hypothetical protein